MAHAPGYDKLMEWTDAPIMPTPGAVGDILQTIARTAGDQRGRRGHRRRDDGRLQRLRRHLQPDGERQPRNELLDLERLRRGGDGRTSSAGCTLDMEERELRNRVKNKMIRPTTIPQSAKRWSSSRRWPARRCGWPTSSTRSSRRRSRASSSSGRWATRSARRSAVRRIVDNMTLDLLVASGGVLSHAPRMQQTAMLLIDAFEPEGFTTLAKDSIFMMPHLGVLAPVHAKAAMEVFERDCLVYPRNLRGREGPGQARQAVLLLQDHRGHDGRRGARLRRSRDGAARDGSDRGRRGHARPRIRSRQRPGQARHPQRSRRRGGDHPRRPRPGPAASRGPDGATTGGDPRGRGAPACTTIWSLRRTARERTMAKAYTPGLKVSARTTHRTRRLLPIPGEVKVAVGDVVEASDVVAETFMAGDITPMNMANRLSCSAGDVAGLHAEADRRAGEGGRADRPQQGDLRGLQDRSHLRCGRDARDRSPRSPVR